MSSRRRKGGIKLVGIIFLAVIAVVLFGEGKDALESTDKQISTNKPIHTTVTKKKRDYKIAFRHHAKAGSDYLLLNFTEKTFIYRYKGTNSSSQHGNIDGDLYEGFSITIDGNTYTYRYAKNEQGRGILMQVFASGNETASGYAEMTEEDIKKYLE